MTMDHAAHAVGVLCLCVFAGAAIFSPYVIAKTIAPNWGRIVAAHRGQSIIPESTKRSPRRVEATSPAAR